MTCEHCEGLIAENERLQQLIDEMEEVLNAHHVR